MATIQRSIAHPKYPKCALCQKWMGNANLVFKAKHIGFEYDVNVKGTCMRDNNPKSSQYGDVCRYYEPSNEASRIL